MLSARRAALEALRTFREPYTPTLRAVSLDAARATALAVEAEQRALPADAAAAAKVVESGGTGSGEGGEGGGEGGEGGEGGVATIVLEGEDLERAQGAELELDGFCAVSLFSLKS